MHFTIGGFKLRHKLFIAYLFILASILVFSSINFNSFQHVTNQSLENTPTTLNKRQATGSISGYIYTNTGTPISGANVSAYNYTVGRFSTNANGAGYYSITNVPAGEYELSAWAIGREYDVDYSVIVPPSGTVSISFYLGPSGVISGTVVTRTSTPIPNAQLRLTISTINTTIIKTTNSAGQFQFSDYLVTGEYTIYTNADGFIQTTSRIHVNSGSTTNVQIILNRSATISGSVKDDLGNSLNGIYVVAYNNTYMGANYSTSGSYVIDHGLGAGIYYLEAYGDGYVRRNFIGPVNLAIEGSATCNIVLNRSAKIHGTVRNTQGYGIQNVKIELNGIDAGVMLTEYTDIAGNYMFDTNLSAGRYVMFLSATGYVSKSIPQFSIGFAEDRTIQVTLNRTGKIYGMVQDQYGAPVVGAQVTAYAQSILGTWTNISDSLGSYSLEGLDAGIYLIYAQANGYVSTGDKTVTLSEGQNLSVTLKLNATGCINGSVSDSQGNPIANALITAKDAFG
ncbi:MAG: carboxypeptidase-like regulatory domain-containing protein, partial [Thermoplasmata archaeon]